MLSICEVYQTILNLFFYVNMKIEKFSIESESSVWRNDD